MSDDHEMFAKAANNRVWDLLGDEQRSAAGDREMVDAAHASLWHWRHAGTAVHEQRGEWLVSHVYAVLGRGDEALTHAQRCFELTEANALTGFDLAYAYEALARAHAALGALDTAQTWLARGHDAAAKVDDPEDRAILDGDLAAGPWYGLA
jgi:hypothetical protein